MAQESRGTKYDDLGAQIQNSDINNNIRQHDCHTIEPVFTYNAYSTISTAKCSHGSQLSFKFESITLYRSFLKDGLKCSLM